MKGVSAVSGGAVSPLVNPGFESGFTGWTISGGSPTIVTEHSSVNDPESGPGPSPWTAVSGARFLRLNTGSAPAGVWRTVSQTVALTAGQVLSGWVAFDWEDYDPYLDDGRVRIYQGATIIATPWQYSDEVREDFNNLPWTFWSWTCPANGTYKLEFGVSNIYDSEVGSFAMFDYALPGCPTLPASSAAMIALLAGYQFFLADLYTITLVDDSIVRLTSGDGDITYACSLFEVGTVRIKRGDITTAVGVEVTEVEVTLLCNADSLFNGLNPQKFAINGGFDGARVKIELAVMPSYGDTSAGAVHLFEGIVTDTMPDMSKVVLTVSSDLVLLNTMTPVKVYQPTCIHTLYDEQCTANDAFFSLSISAYAGSTGYTLYFPSAHPAGFFDQGTVLFTSGANAGAIRTVKSYSPGVAYMVWPFDHAPSVGDGFTITAGCDKLRTTCRTKFSNEANFLGFEYMPVPESSV